MTTSAINNHIREIRAAVSDYCPRSHWAFAWRRARVEGIYYDPIEPHEVILAAACRALRERHDAAPKFATTLKDRLEMSRWSDTETLF